MSTDPESVRIEVAFAGGPIIGANVPPSGADALEQALVGGRAGHPPARHRRRPHRDRARPRRVHEAVCPRFPRRLRPLTPPAAEASGRERLTWILAATLRRRGSRGRHRRSAQRREDDSLQRPHEGGRGDHRVCLRDGQVQRRHGHDRGRPARPSRGARGRPQGDTGRDSRAGRSRYRSRAPRGTATGGRPAGGRRRVLRRRRSHRATSARSSSSCSSPTRTTLPSASSAWESRRSRVTLRCARRRRPSPRCWRTSSRASRSPSGRASCLLSSTR